MALEEITPEEYLGLSVSYPEIDVNLSIAFTLSSRFVPGLLEKLVKMLPLTASLEVEFREVLTVHTNGSEA
jgi:hypothetical protein